MLRTVLISLTLILLSGTTYAQDLAGIWSANVSTPQGSMVIGFEFEVSGSGVTGTMSNDFTGATPISEGSINGQDVAFTINMQGGPGGAMTINFTGALDGDNLNLTSSFAGAPPGGGPAEQSIMATRVK